MADSTRKPHSPTRASPSAPRGSPSPPRGTTSPAPPRGSPSHAPPRGSPSHAPHASPPRAAPSTPHGSPSPPRGTPSPPRGSPSPPRGTPSPPRGTTSNAPKGKHSPKRPHSPQRRSHRSGRKKTKIKKMAARSKETVQAVGETSKNIALNLLIMLIMHPVRWITIGIREFMRVYTRLFECLPTVNTFCFGPSLRTGCAVIGLCIIGRCAYILYWLLVLTWCIPRNMAIIALSWQYVYTGYELFMVVLSVIFLKFVIYSHKAHISVVWMQYAGFLDSLASLLLAVSWIAAMRFGRPYLRHKYKLPCKFPRQVVITSFIWSFIWIYFIIVISSYRREKETEEKLAKEAAEDA